MLLAKAEKEFIDFVSLSLLAHSTVSFFSSRILSLPTQPIQLTDLACRCCRRLSHQSIWPPFRFRPPSLLHNRPFASHLQPTTAMEDSAAVVATDPTADPAPLGLVFWWVWTVFGLGFPVSFNWFWVGLIFGFLLILDWVDFWVYVDFGICFYARLRCLVVALGLVVGFVVVWWWR